MFDDFPLMNPSFRSPHCWRKYSDLLLNKKEAKPQSNETLLQVHFYIKFGQKYLNYPGLLKKNTVKVLNIIHASSLGSTKLSSKGI